MELQGRAKANGSSRPSREVTEEKDVFKEVPLRYMGKQTFQIHVLK